MSLRSCGLRRYEAALRFGFAEIALEIGGIARPIRGQDTLADIVMERRVRPIADPPHQAVFDGIEMNVVDVAREIVFVANGVLPEPTLPQRQIAVRTAAQGSALLDQGAAETAFDSSPTSRKIRHRSAAR